MAGQKLGQHFLVQTKTLIRIAKAACGDGVERVIEIGPGKGALTEYLIPLAGETIAIELDPALAANLRERFGASLQLLEANALHVDFTRWGAGVLAGNLPYYAATAMITAYLRKPGELRHAVFLIQKEVAERMTAAPGQKDYGSLSVACQFLAKCEYLFTVKPGAFQPPPKVDSAVIRFTPRPADVEDVEGFLSFATACFRQKRKMLRNNLSGQYEIQGEHDLSLRAEQLAIPQLLALFRDAAKIT